MSEWLSNKTLLKTCIDSILIILTGTEIISRVGKWVSTLLKTSFLHFCFSSMAGVLYFLNVFVQLLNISLSRFFLMIGQNKSTDYIHDESSNKVHSLSAQQATISCHLFIFEQGQNLETKPCVTRPRSYTSWWSGGEGSEIKTGACISEFCR